MSVSASDEYNTTGNYIVEGEENLTAAHNIIESSEIGQKKYFLVNSTGISTLDASDKPHMYKEYIYYATGSFSEKPHRKTVRAMNAEGVPDVDVGAENVDVAVIDSGVDDEHPYIDDVVWHKDYTGSDNNPNDLDGHGTHVAGLVAADYNSGNNMRGIAPSVDIYNLKILEGGSGTGFSIVQAAGDAVEGPDNKKGTKDDAEVVSLSIGGKGPLGIDNLASKNPQVTFVTSAGNTDGGEVTYPARSDDVLAVSSVNGGLSPSSFSAKSPNVDVATVGNNVLSLGRNGGGYTRKSGTSFSAPQASAAAALLMAEKDLTSKQVRQAIKDTAQDVHRTGVDDATGHGVINVPNLLSTNFPPSNTRISPNVNKLRQRETTFDVGANDPDGKIEQIKYDIVSPSGTTSNTISSRSFSKDFSSLNEGDEVKVKVEVTDDGGKTGKEERTYEIWKDKQPDITVKEFYANERYMGGKDPTVEVTLKNEAPVRAKFTGLIKHKGKLKKKFTKHFSPNELKRISMKVSFNTVGTKKLKIESKNRDIGKVTTETKIKNPFNFGLSVDDKSPLKTESVNVTLDIVRKSRTEVIASSRGEIIINGTSRDFSRTVGVRPGTVKEEFVMNNSGEHYVKVNFNKPKISTKKKKINVRCISRRNVSRGQEKYECGNEEFDTSGRTPRR